MRIGVPTELKDGEGRVAVTPAVARELAARGHEVTVQRGAGERSGHQDGEYEAAGARLAGASAVWSGADLICKVKEPQPQEYGLFREELVLFCYLHLASDRQLTAALQQSGCTAVAFETIPGEGGDLPLLAPMSRIAGTLAAQIAACGTFATAGGRGLLLGGMPGVPPARVLVVGGGVVGRSAARTAADLGAEVTVLDIDAAKLEQLDAELPRRSRTVFSSSSALAEELAAADVVIGAVLVPGAPAPRLITREAVRSMRPRALLVDVAIDQGGCSETSRMTTHSEPTYVVDDVVHYCVGNMPAAVPRTASAALSNVVFPYLCALAERPLPQLVRARPDIAQGVNVLGGAVTYRQVAQAHGFPSTSLEQAVATARSRVKTS
jgi:alanine dehydrogenase